MIDTAGDTTAARERRYRTARAAVVVFVVAGTFAGCESDARTYRLGEGAPDSSGYELAYAESGGAEEIGTPTTAVEPWGVGCRQLFAGGRSGTAVLLQQPCGENHQVFAVTGDFWALYRSAGDMATVKYGFPVGRRGEWKQGWTQGFGRDGAFSTFFMQRLGEEPHTVTVPILEYYLSFADRDIRFGYPTADLLQRRERLCQEFEHAVITATAIVDHFSFEASTGRPDTGAPRCS